MFYTNLLSLVSMSEKEFKELNCSLNLKLKNMFENMENLSLLIIDICSYDDIDDDEKLEKILELAHEHKKYQSNLLTLAEYVKTDIENGHFDLNNVHVDKDYYLRILNINEKNRK